MKNQKTNKIAVRPRRSQWKSFIPFYIMALPGIAYLICNNFMPMYGVLLAFKKLDVRKGILGSPWCGFQNFKFLFQSDTAFTIIRNTLLYNLSFIIFGTMIALALAILLNEIKSKTASRLYQSLILIPYLMSWVIASYLVYAILSQDVGLINNSILKPLGLEPVNWYMEKSYWPFILFFCQIWKTSGYNLIIYYSSIVGIGSDYYEAAMLDGATKWQQIVKITLPLLKPTVVTMAVLGIGKIAVSDFGLFFQIPRNSTALYSVTQTLDVYVYNALMNNSDFTMSAAASVFQSVLGFVLVLITNAFVKKYNRENALF